MPRSGQRVRSLTQPRVVSAASRCKAGLVQSEVATPLVVPQHSIVSPSIFEEFRNAYSMARVGVTQRCQL